MKTDLNRLKNVQKNRYLHLRVKPITICIGTICDNKNRAIAIADRMITDDALSIEFEHEEKKITQISENCIVMTAGSSTSFQEILEPIISKFKGKKPKITEITEEIAKSYNEIRKKKIDEKYFRPRGLSINKFYEEQAGLSERLIERLDSVVDQFEFPDLDFPAGLEILVVGVDDKAHIYAIDNPGTIMPFDELGWRCIGSGYPQAENSLISNKFNPSSSFNKALYLTFEAKKKAEVSPGVGKIHTDIIYIDERGVHFLTENSQKSLNDIFKEKENKIKPIDKEIDDKLSGLTLW